MQWKLCIFVIILDVVWILRTAIVVVGYLSGSKFFLGERVLTLEGCIDVSALSADQAIQLLERRFE